MLLSHLVFLDNLLKKIILSAWKMAQELRDLTALPEDQVSIPSIYMAHEYL